MEDDPYLSWLYYIYRQTDIPQTISASYASFEKDVPRNYANAMCWHFAELGARGVSVLFANADFDVGERNCSTNGNVRFMPTFPASCMCNFCKSSVVTSFITPHRHAFAGPWVTSVGGTTRFDYPEVAAGFGGDGFSDYFPCPCYQDEAVPTFLLYNRRSAEGRGFPDIATQATDVVVFFRDEDLAVQGTSWSVGIFHPKAS